MRNFLWMFLIGLFISIVNSTKLYADSLRVTQTVSGVSGLIEMPSARMLEDGEFAVHLSSATPYQRYAIVGQPLPWLQVLFKYTDIENVLYGAESLSGSQSYKDKSTDLKVQLFEESYYFPAIALGINDIGGTGLFSGEYIVASKQVKNIDFTLGLGWGYLGRQGHFNNPLSLLSESFNRRKSSSGGSGGTIDSSVFFSGDKVSLFAGIEYHLENTPLALKFEYDANNYQNEPFNQVFEQKTPLNFGAVYSFKNAIDLHLGYVRGTTAMLGLTFRTNFKSSGAKKIFDPDPIVVKEQFLVSKSPSWPDLRKQFLQKSGYDLHSISQKENALILKGKQQDYRETAQGIGRASRLLANKVPSEVDTFVFVDEFRGVGISSVVIDRASFEAAAKLETNSEAVLLSTKFVATTDQQSASLLYRAPRKTFNYQLKPSFSGSFGGPDEFLLYQISLSANANYFLRDNTWLSGSINLGIVDNYDQFEYTASSNLPRVRTNIKEYLTSSKLRLQRLQVSNFERVFDDLFFMGYAGYLESMYAGMGAELLYRPHATQWALGLDMNYVKQREFEQKLMFRDYSVITGHLTGYYQLGNDILFKLSAGQYLAKDKGVTLDVSRHFRSGAKMGFWATKTNVSAEQFGEGSFDKGFYFSIPLNLFTLKSTKQTVGISWQFLTRDGGQKLHKKYDLYRLTDSRDIGFVKASFKDVLR